MAVVIVYLKPLPVDLSDEGGQAHGNELQEFLHCVKLHYHGYIHIYYLCRVTLSICYHVITEIFKKGTVI